MIRRFSVVLGALVLALAYMHVDSPTGQPADIADIDPWVVNQSMDVTTEIEVVGSTGIGSPVSGIIDHDQIVEVGLLQEYEQRRANRRAGRTLVLQIEHLIERPRRVALQELLHRARVGWCELEIRDVLGLIIADADHDGPALVDSGRGERLDDLTTRTPSHDRDAVLTDREGKLTCEEPCVCRIESQSARLRC